MLNKLNENTIEMKISKSIKKKFNIQAKHQITQSVGEILRDIQKRITIYQFQINSEAFLHLGLVGWPVRLLRMALIVNAGSCLSMMIPVICNGWVLLRRP